MKEIKQNKQEKLSIRHIHLESPRHHFKAKTVGDYNLQSLETQTGKTAVSVVLYWW